MAVGGYPVEAGIVEDTASEKLRKEEAQLSLGNNASQAKSAEAVEEMRVNHYLHFSPIQIHSCYAPTDNLLLNE